MLLYKHHYSLPLYSVVSSSVRQRKTLIFFTKPLFLCFNDAKNLRKYGKFNYKKII